MKLMKSISKSPSEFSGAGTTISGRRKPRHRCTNTHARPPSESPPVPLPLAASDIPTPTTVSLSIRTLPALSHAGRETSAAVKNGQVGHTTRASTRQLRTSEVGATYARLGAGAYIPGVVYDHGTDAEAEEVQCENEGVPPAPTLPVPPGHVDEQRGMRCVPAFPFGDVEPDLHAACAGGDEEQGRAIDGMRTTSRRRIRRWGGGTGAGTHTMQGTSQQLTSTRPPLLPPQQRMHAASPVLLSAAAVPSALRESGQRPTASNGIRPEVLAASARAPCRPPLPPSPCSRRCSRAAPAWEQLQRKSWRPPREPRAARHFRPRRAPAPPLPHTATISPLRELRTQRAELDCDHRRPKSPHRARSSQGVAARNVPLRRRCASPVLRAQCRLRMRGSVHARGSSNASSAFVARRCGS
ncbi:hypothetical protein B0H15DRAFT_797102 [Mycena belliarum]|uniref:Uncharacterized protein n=1 Tax=Mycena belliarum TaxID=1033014 RepID=A0AAD6XTY2_9AGAR|nr:hypothetical protein B0H15DRAFT_797102 [Mycena belliae]